MPISKLSAVDEFEGIVVAFACTEKDYRVAWAINRVLGLRLKQVPEFELFKKDGSGEILFGCFEHDDRKNYKKWRMLNNRSDSGILLQEYKNFDFLLIGFGEFDFSETEKIISRMRTVRFITAAYNIPAKNNRMKELLML